MWCYDKTYLVIVKTAKLKLILSCDCENCQTEIIIVSLVYVVLWWNISCDCKNFQTEIDCMVGMLSFTCNYLQVQISIYNYLVSTTIYTYRLTASLLGVSKTLVAENYTLRMFVKPIQLSINNFICTNQQKCSDHGYYIISTGIVYQLLVKVTIAISITVASDMAIPVWNCPKVINRYRVIISQCLTAITFCLPEAINK